MIEARQLTVRRGARDVARDIDVSVARGEVCVVLGPNGAGKTTLLESLAGESQTSQGQAWLDGVDVRKLSVRELARRRAMLPQRAALQFDLSVAEVVRLGRLAFAESPSVTTSHVCAALEEVGMLWALEHSYLRLSGGERQRVQLARAFAHAAGTKADTPLSAAFFDEPVANLDPNHQHATLRAIRAVAARGSAVLMVLHDLNLALAYADHVLLLQEGRLLAAGRTSDVCTSCRLSALYDFTFTVADVHAGAECCARVVVASAPPSTQ
jgi:iron complex transport system ATP-binding protein